MTENVVAPENLAAKLIDALGQKQDELNRVARVLHEDVGQVLTVVGLQLDVLRQDFSAQAPELPARVQEIQQLLETAINDVRQLTYDLNPDIVPRSGLRYALDTLIGRMRDSGGATIRFLMDSHLHLAPPVAAAIYEITERALVNALQHSGAALVEVVLQPVSGQVRLEVVDNGCGFDCAQAESQPTGLGLLWMRHAAKKAGMSLRIESGAGKGTTIQAVHRDGDNPSTSSPDGRT